MKTLVIVESPNKAKKLSTFLGPDFIVKASFGHVADLPPKEYGVDLATLEESYVLRGKGAEIVRTLKAAVKAGTYDRVLLASDPDREGEAIAWHLARRLGVGARTPSRIEFREITPTAVRRALAEPRPVDGRRVDAQRSRRVLDRIVGFDCSKEICWPAGAQSAGRCQTPALHLLCEREREILAFVARTYFTLEATYAEGFTAFVPAVPNEEEKQEKLVARQFVSREEAESVLDESRRHPHVVRAIDARRTERRPPPPYTTSTLQQDASRKLRLSAKQAMDGAQALFEAGLITYHRTDSTRVSDDAQDMARAFLAEHHPDVLPDAAPRTRAKSGAQDAHEAIRPTALGAQDVPAPLRKLYDMIRARFLASQSKPAVFDRTTVWIDAGPVAWVAEGAVLREAGFLTFWGPYTRQEDVVLPALAPGQRVTPTDLVVHERETSPPSRYDQGALIKKLETSGIGRPATFANIIATLLERDYARELDAGRGKKFLQPTEFGMQVDGLVTHAFPALVSEQYTADMEAQLDAIERGDATRPAYLRAWYDDFREAMRRAESLGAEYRAAHGLRSRRAGGGAAAEETSTRCDRCGEANYRKIQRKRGKGSFLACPACRMTRDVRAKVRPNACPTCGSALIQKKIGRKPPFWGCVRYGADTNPCSYADFSAPTDPQRARTTTDKPCPKCARGMLEIRTPTAGGGTPYYACPERGCRFQLTVGAKRRREPCPTCGGVVLERWVKRGRDPDAPTEAVWRCARHPSCRYEAEWVTPASSPR